ncbi:hypothetical protein BD626DRAFT_564730 [Schizophyllum amplum]|uniref:Uncharacterized protein n=1 Tax=Schizophyllum amplum TaxID=97359 RepID=A0A550CSS2_9AGAR|nr:hypothetical protein BD626DRAFT_564730 [Auriculariopsis ampla]
MFDSFKIRRATKAKAALYPASTFPACHHPCTATSCNYANPPSRSAGTFRCRGAPSGPFTCTGLYVVTGKEAKANQQYWEARRASRLAQARAEEERLAREKKKREGRAAEVKQARTALWEEDMRAWGREMEGREQYARDKAVRKEARRLRRAERYERPRAPTPEQSWRESAVAYLQHQLPDGHAHVGRDNGQRARQWVVHNV